MEAGGGGTHEGKSDIAKLTETENSSIYVFCSKSSHKITQVAVYNEPA